MISSAAKARRRPQVVQPENANALMMFDVRIACSMVIRYNKLVYYGKTLGKLSQRFELSCEELFFFFFLPVTDSSCHHNV